MTQPIVVAVSEGDEARDAVALGVTASRLMNAPLVLAGVAVTAAKPMRDYLARELERRAATVPEDVPCGARVAVASGVLPGLETVVEEEDAQLLVVGGSHLGPLARALRGDIGTDAVRRAGCAVLVAPSGADGADGAALADPPRLIGVAWDGDQESDAALELGAALAARAGARLIVLRAVGHAHAADVRAALDDVVDHHRVRVPTEGRLLTGPPEANLVAATADLDLMLLGAHERSAMATALLGSVSATVLRHARCPVLVMPHGARVAVTPAAVAR